MPTGRQDNEFAKIMEGEISTITVAASALDNAVNWIGDNLEPDDVFTTGQLEAWAERNGYIKE